MAHGHTVSFVFIGLMFKILLPEFEIKSTDLGGRICSLKTKTSQIETPALLPVIHPVRQLVTCDEIKAMGFQAVMTNSYTTYRRLKDRASEGIHKIIGFDGTIMTDSGGYQVLEFGSVDVGSLDIASFQEKLGSDIAIILDKPTGLDVTRSYAKKTVVETLQSAKQTMESLTRDDMIWTLPIQGGKYLDLVERSAKMSSKLEFGCYALGSPVEVMEEYDFSLLVQMIVASKKHLPLGKPFHLFGAGHPLIIPLAIALGCDTFDSASYMLYAKQDRYMSTAGTIRLEHLEYLACPCKVCSSMAARELKSLKKEERTRAIATHNLFTLQRVVKETKQAIWEGRLWEYVKANSTNHPKALQAFNLATSKASAIFESGTPQFKDRGIFLSDENDLRRPEVARFSKRMRSIDLSEKRDLIIVPETKSKPFLISSIFQEIAKLIEPKNTMITFISPIFGLVPWEISDIFPLSQMTETLHRFPERDALLSMKEWQKIYALAKPGDVSGTWIKNQIKKNRTKKTEVLLSRTYKSLKSKIESGVD